jgi:hypothetical protein
MLLTSYVFCFIISMDSLQYYRTYIVQCILTDQLNFTARLGIEVNSTNFDLSTKRWQSTVLYCSAEGLQ